MTGSIHIKLDYPEAVSLKRDSLLLEKDFLETIRYMRNYVQLRNKEFLLKSRVKKDMETTMNLISSLEAMLPKHETTEVIKGSIKNKIEKEEVIKKIKTKAIEKKKSDIEREIDEIREKLAALGSEGL